MYCMICLCYVIYPSVRSSHLHSWNCSDSDIDLHITTIQGFATSRSIESLDRDIVERVSKQQGNWTKYSEVCEIDAKSSPTEAVTSDWFSSQKLNPDRLTIVDPIPFPCLTKVHTCYLPEFWDSLVRHVDLGESWVSEEKPWTSEKKHASSERRNWLVARLS
jgi:hypothetical protein